MEIEWFFSQLLFHWRVSEKKFSLCRDVSIDRKLPSDFFFWQRKFHRRRGDSICSSFVRDFHLISKSLSQILAYHATSSCIMDERKVFLPSSIHYESFSFINFPQPTSALHEDSICSPARLSITLFSYPLSPTSSRGGKLQVTSLVRINLLLVEEN